MPQLSLHACSKHASTCRCQVKTGQVLRPTTAAEHSNSATAEASSTTRLPLHGLPPQKCPATTARGCQRLLRPTTAAEHALNQRCATTGQRFARVTA
eukprot:2537653-Alexandrium_andersonii.AAC.1